MKKIFGFSLILAAAFGLSRRASAIPPPAMGVVSESGSVMYTDLGNGLDSTYLVFQITNTGGLASDVWAQLDTSASTIISNVGAGQHELRFQMSTGAHGSVPSGQLGLAQNETKGVFFLVKATQTTNTPQKLTVRLSSTNANTADYGTFDFNFTVADTIQASANKVKTVITIPNNPQIGQLGKITVTGCTGTVGAGKVLYFSPVSSHTWPADAFEFIDSDIQIENYTGSPYRDVALIPNADVLTTDNCYDEIFTFVIDAVGTATTSPSNFITSGGSNVKHTTTNSGSFAVVVPPAECPTITVSSTPASLPDAVPGVLYSVTFSALPAPGGTYSFSSTTLPSWLSLNSATGVLSGTPGPGDVGSVSFTITATDSGGEPVGCTGQAQFGFNVLCPTITVTSTPSVLPDAVAGQFYSASFHASPAGTYTFSATGLPSWLTLSPSGTLSGTPTSGDVGPVSFTVTATDSNTACTGEDEAGFSVDPATVAAQIPTLGGVGFALLGLSLAGAAFLLIRR